jgi:hypothetical protein
VAQACYEVARNTRGLGGSRSVRRFLQPGPCPGTYAASARGASGCAGHVLNDQRRRLIGVIVFHLDDTQRPSTQRDRVASVPAAVCSVGGSAGVPSSWTSLNMKTIRSPVPSPAWAEWRVQAVGPTLDRAERQRQARTTLEPKLGASCPRRAAGSPGHRRGAGSFGIWR